MKKCLLLTTFGNFCATVVGMDREEEEASKKGPIRPLKRRERILVISLAPRPFPSGLGCVPPTSLQKLHCCPRSSLTTHTGCGRPVLPAPCSLEKGLCNDRRAELLMGCHAVTAWLLCGCTAGDTSRSFTLTFFQILPPDLLLLPHFQCCWEVTSRKASGCSSRGRWGGMKTIWRWPEYGQGWL